MHSMQASEPVVGGQLYGRILEVCCTITGMFLPLGIQRVMGHSHTT
jgi:hypothetical protein